MSSSVKFFEPTVTVGLDAACSAGGQAASRVRTAVAQTSKIQRRGLPLLTLLRIRAIEWYIPFVLRVWSW
jgi:hypothetical protein